MVDRCKSDFHNRSRTFSLRTGHRTRSSVPFLCGTGTETVLIYFLELEPEALHKSKELPNTVRTLRVGMALRLGQLPEEGPLQGRSQSVGPFLVMPLTKALTRHKDRWGFFFLFLSFNFFP